MLDYNNILQHNIIREYNRRVFFPPIGLDLNNPNFSCYSERLSCLIIVNNFSGFITTR